MREQVLNLQSGFPVVGFPREFARIVHESCPIFQHRDFEEFFSTLSRQMMAEDRWEYICWSDDNQVLASMCIVLDPSDLHTGEPTLFPMVAFSTETGLLKGAYRTMFRLAQENNIQWVLWTRETEPFKYELVYRKVKQ